MPGSIKCHVSCLRFLGNTREIQISIRLLFSQLATSVIRVELLVDSCVTINCDSINCIRETCSFDENLQV